MIFQMCFYFGIVGVCLDHAKVAIFVDSNLFWQRATLTPMEHHNPCIQTLGLPDSCVANRAWDISAGTAIVALDL